MNILEKIQNLPERTRKIILWLVIIIIGIILLFFFLNNFQERLKNLETEKTKEELKIPSLEEELKNLPKIPKINE